jgi:hypothetical protein
MASRRVSGAARGAEVASLARAAAAAGGAVRAAAVLRGAVIGCAVAALLAGCGGAAGVVARPPSIGAVAPGDELALASVAGDDDPAATVLAWSEAMARGDVEALWALLASSVREGTDRERFGAALADAAEELRAQATALRARARAGEVVARARQTLASGEAVTLVRDPDGWRMDGGVLDAGGLRSPEDAVIALRRALLRRSLPGVLRLLARGVRAQVEAELARVIDATAHPEALDARVDGDDAVVVLPGGGAVRLRREASEWRIVDVE